jgi:hypothetical protein
MEKNSRKKPRIRAYAFAAVAVALTVLVSGPAPAQSLFLFLPGNLVVSRSVYDNNPNNVSVGETLPPNCTSGCGVATNNGSYPEVFDNVLVDPSFGITSRIFLDQITPFGLRIGSLEVPDGAQSGFPSERGPVVTSFSSKSELALNLSTDRRSLTFMGYVAPIDTVDVSNANTPGVIDPTNPVPGAYYRAAAKVDAFGGFRFTETNAYSGDNGRAAIFNDAADAFYTSGNAGNGNNPQPLGVILGAGAQFISPSDLPLADQDPGTPTPLASFSITELPANKKPDKIGKDDNFRGLAIFNNVVYYTKGSGSNGINTVYFVDTTGTACPDGIGLPASGATLPTSPLAYDPSTVATDGLPNNMCILNGFNTTLAKTSTTSFPFGLWFANANTVYVADEGDGTIADAGTSTTAGLQKWIFNTATSTWQLAYVLQNGLGLGVAYTVSGYPTGINPATGVAWAPETDGLRNITGIVERNGTATIYAITSTVSGGGDQGADPNKLVAISDNLSATTLPVSESFKTIRSAGFGEVLRGVSWTPDIF